MNTLWRRATSLLVSYRSLGQGFARKSMFTGIFSCRSYMKYSLLKIPQIPAVTATTRHKSKKAQHDSDDEDEVFDDDASLSRDSKVVKFSTTSMRTDIILKLALGVSRSKVETMFYESRIRLNGKKIMKKSAAVRQGDEIDVVKAFSPNNPEHLYISRVEVISVTPKEDSISVSARRFKSLLIENYDDPYKASDSIETKVS